eukprot:2590245-Alexandrium_andersonii.AAC.1
MYGARSCTMPSLCKFDHPPLPNVDSPDICFRRPRRFNLALGVSQLRSVRRRFVCTAELR